ncbi:MAG TPA: hypothetical protein VFL83_03870 [Anaeromyxobacter sp.]|nr:hypothetical protein [Anaeromyxobacter sp.]
MTNRASCTSTARAAAAALAVLAAARVAAAGYGASGYGGTAVSREAWPTALALRPLTLARGMVEIAAPVGFDVTSGAGGEPVTLPLAVHAGVTDWLTAGIGHARGLCVTGADGGCATVYDDVTVDALARFWSAGAFSAGYGAALTAAPLHGGVALSAAARLELRVARDPVALDLAAIYGFGLSRRDVDRAAAVRFPLAASVSFGAFETRPNRETVTVPLTALVQLGSRAALAAAVALDGVLDPASGSFGASYRVPAGLAAIVTPSAAVDVGAGLAFPNLWGRSDAARPRSDVRTLEVFLAVRPGATARRAALPAAAVAATTAAATDAPATPYAIVIAGHTFAPASLEVPPGATVAVRNLDSAPHSVTSERAPGAFEPGAVAGVSFDTGTFGAGERAFTIPAGAAPGTVIPYYCATHRGAMRTPDGELRIVAPR